MHLDPTIVTSTSSYYRQLLLRNAVKIQILKQKKDGPAIVPDGNCRSRRRIILSGIKLKEIVARDSSVDRSMFTLRSRRHLKNMQWLNLEFKRVYSKIEQKLVVETTGIQITIGRPGPRKVTGGRCSLKKKRGPARFRQSCKRMIENWKIQTKQNYDRPKTKETDTSGHGEVMKIEVGVMH